MHCRCYADQNNAPPWQIIAVPMPSFAPLFSTFATQFSTERIQSASERSFPFLRFVFPFAVSPCQCNPTHIPSNSRRLKSCPSLFLSFASKFSIILCPCASIPCFASAYHSWLSSSVASDRPATPLHFVANLLLSMSNQIKSMPMQLTTPP